MTEGLHCDFANDRIVEIGYVALSRIAIIMRSARMVRRLARRKLPRGLSAKRNDLEFVILAKPI